MCSNFEPATIKQIEAVINDQFKLDMESYKGRVYPKDYCPIIIPAHLEGDSKSSMQIVRGQFGLSPKWASDPVDYATYNARLETVENKKTFEPPFTQNQFCLVPMQAFFEPYYVDNKNHWQRIFRKDAAAFTIAGMFEYNPHFDEPVYSFTLLTHNADNEAFMQRFHRPDKEKRSIYLVEPNNREDYLRASHNEITDLMALIKGDDFDYKDSE